MTAQFQPHELTNVHGSPWKPSLASVTPVKRKPVEAEPKHNGWKVIGHPPGAMEEARKSLEAEIVVAEREASQKRGITIPKPWDEAAWRMKTKKKPVRSKGYEIPEAAQQCAELAKKAGWLDVQVIEQKKE